MQSVFVLIGILFILGCIGTFLNNRRLDYNGKKGNWIKYLVYFCIVFTVIGTVLIDKKLFAALMIIVSSVGVIEMMVVGNKNELSKLRKKILVLSLVMFNIMFALFSAFVLLPENVIIYTYTIVLTVDGGGQIFGRLFGRRKITPKISPNKTWGGFIYGSMLGLLTAFLLKDLVYYSWWQSLVYGVIVCISAFSGDILASAFKRAFVAKDFGHSLPGQGGMFDRFDSFLFSGAIVGLFGILYLSVNVYDKDILLYFGLTSLFWFILLIGELLHLFAKLESRFVQLSGQFLAAIPWALLLSLFSSPYYALALGIQSVLFLYFLTKAGMYKSLHQDSFKAL